MAEKAAAAAARPALKQRFISVGCNRLVNVLDWSSEGLVAYGAGAMVTILNPLRAAILRTLIAHTMRVNVVRWLPGNQGGSMQLVSGGADKFIAQWTISFDGQVQPGNEKPFLLIIVIFPIVELYQRLFL